MPIKPPRLSRGDTIGIVSPASAPIDPRAIDRSVIIQIFKVVWNPISIIIVRKAGGQVYRNVVQSNIHCGIRFLYLVSCGAEVIK